MHSFCRSLLVLVLPACSDVPSTHGPARVLSLHDTTTELVVGVGGADHLIGIVEPTGVSPAALSMIEGVHRLPQGPLSVEAIAALAPTHVVGTDANLEQRPHLAQRLAALGIEGVFLDPAGLDGLWRSIDSMGRMLDAEENARRWRSELEAQVAAEATPEGAPVRVFLYDCCDPPFTAGGRVPLGDLLGLLGAQNVFDDLDQDWTRVSWEAVIARDPELIVVHDYAYAGQGEAREKLTRLRSLPFLQEVAAIEADHLVVMPLALALEGPRTIEALDWLRPHVEAARKDRR